jgi:Uma2 family endonuclease
MSVTTREAPARRDAPPAGETRIAIPGMTWDAYATFVRLLPEGSPVRVAFDGEVMELMVIGPIHDDLAETLDAFFKAAAGGMGVRYKPMRTTTWIRPEVQRGIEGDNCYYLDPGKIAAAFASLKAGSNDVKDYSNPDLAIEVDISRPRADRQAIYAALRVGELWLHNGESLRILRLGEDGHYHPAEASAFLHVRPEEVERWLRDEGRQDLDAWARRIRAWARKTLKKRRP